jgi:hypothetical protein
MPVKRTIVEHDAGVVAISECPGCRQLAILIMQPNEYNEWRKGIPAIVAFGDTPVEQLGVLETGFCADCTKLALVQSAKLVKRR